MLGDVLREKSVPFFEATASVLACLFGLLGQSEILSFIFKTRFQLLPSVSQLLLGEVRLVEIAQKLLEEGKMVGVRQSRKVEYSYFLHDFSSFR